MRTRTYGFILLATVAIAPLGVFGYLALRQAENTAMVEARAGNLRLARQVAGRLTAYLAGERRLLASVGAAVVQASDDRSARTLLETYALDYQHLHALAVYRADGTLWAGASASADRALVARALAGEAAQSSVRPARGNRGGGFAHTMVVGEPLMIAGKREGAIIATVDLIEIWPAVNAVRVGRTGFARLLTRDGELLAHGNPEERRFVFSADPAAGRALIRRALLSRSVIDQQGRRVVATMAAVPDIDWLVVVEQEVAEAFRSARAVRRDLAVLALVTLVVVLGLGLLFGRTIVRGLERLRVHTRVLAGGDLAATAPADSRLVEITALGQALDEMASSLTELQAEARARERMQTFANTAAGLAHDLRAPIEAVRDAVDAAVASPDDGEAREWLTRVNNRELPRLNDYLRDLHRLAKRGDVQAEFLRTEPAALLDTVVSDFTASPRWREVGFSSSGSAAAIDADPKLLHRALFNLGANAAAACLHKGGGTVRFELEDGARALTIRVIDSGVGIAAERLSGLLAADFHSTERTSGIGLGIGVARHVVESHGGHLDVDSEVGVGTTFAITLPRDQREAKEGLRNDRSTSA